jgi:bifunctional UDP-N-acetylglucosamine pyrophosphorylase/glucosamine-1-phosphate N-acetyltransferase
VKAKPKSLAAIILAAGEGTRMKSRYPKVLQRIGGRSLLHWVLETAKAAGAKKRVIVLGHCADEVMKTLPQDIKTVRQKYILGTAHAVKTAQKVLAQAAGEALVLCGDAPLLRPRTLRRLVREHRRHGAQATVLTAYVSEPAQPCLLARIVEERDATSAERRVCEVNSGAYCFSLPALWKALAQVKNRNKKKEYYLTDVVALLRAKGAKVLAVSMPDATEILGVNSRKDLAQAAAVINHRKLESLMESGVTVWDPARTWVEPDVQVGQDTELLPGTSLTGHTVIGRENRIGPDAHLDSTHTGRGVCICYSFLEGSRLNDYVIVGPYSHLRKGTRVDSHVHIGNFVETNRSWLKSGVKMGHF